MAASTPVGSAIGLHAAGGRLQRLDILHVLGRRHACWKLSGARTPRRMDSFRTGSRAAKNKRPVLPPPDPWATGYSGSDNSAIPRHSPGNRQSHASFMLRGKYTQKIKKVLEAQTTSRHETAACTNRCRCIEPFLEFFKSLKHFPDAVDIAVGERESDGLSTGPA